MRRIVFSSSSFALALLVVTGCEAPAPAGACPTETTGPTVHHGTITGEETWTAAASPHVVDGDVEVTEGGKLTIEPCAEVRFASGTGLAVAYDGEDEHGTLVAEGTEEAPIHLHGDGGARWSGVVVAAPGSATLRHVILEGTSGDAPWGRGSLTIYGDDQLPVKKPVLVDHVTLKDSGAFGVEAHWLAGFAEGSTDLEITGAAQYPMLVGENELDSIPPGAYTGNANDAIELVSEGAGVAGSGLQADATLHDRGVPYVVGVDSEDTIIVGGTLSGEPATLTIEPGVEMRFMHDSVLAVELFTGQDELATGVLRAVGTADKPIVFTSGENAPKPGDWQGIWFGNRIRPENRIENARIEYAGGDIHASLATCNAPPVFSAGVILTSAPSDAFVQHTTFSHITGYGVLRGWAGPSAPHFVDTNTFEDVSACAESAPTGPDNDCPDTPPACL